jgi:XTP/dITP diphosphohydrolase
MQLVLASGNKGKLREFRAMQKEWEAPIVPFGDVMEPFEIVEDGDTFAANALIKAQAIYRGLTSGKSVQDEKDPRHFEPDPSFRSRSGISPEREEILHPVILNSILYQDDKHIVISDDSGISVPALGGEPGIYSARYAGEDASDKENLRKLIDTLKSRGIKRTPAYYTAAIAIVSARGKYVVHGWMYGEVIAKARGEKGFGYDPMFIPEGYDQTLGELEDTVKKSISHRNKALELARPIIGMLSR